jgi:hypothetical protein
VEDDTQIELGESRGPGENELPPPDFFDPKEKPPTTFTEKAKERTQKLLWNR